REEQALDPVAVSDALLHQNLAFANDPAAILLIGCGDAQHRAHPRLAALESEQRPDQGLSIEPVRFHPSSAPGRRDRRRIDDMAFVTFGFENPVHPEAVETGLLDRDEWIVPTSSVAGFLFQLPQASKKSCNVTAGNAVARQLLAGARRDRRDQPGVL